MATIAADTFTRTVSGGWGTATTGGAWTPSNASYYSCNGSQGIIAITAGNTTFNRLAVSSNSTEVFVDFGLSALTNTGNLYAYIHPRSFTESSSASTAYGVAVQVGTTGAVTLFLEVNGVDSLSTATGLTITSADRVAARVQVVGVSPTTINARVWKVGTTEPTGWQLTATDSTTGLQTAGGIALGSFLSSTSTNGPISLSYDNLTAATVTASNVPPTVNAGPDQTATAGSTVTLTGTATDSDGTIASRQWTCTSSPGATPTITNATANVATFIASPAGVYTFQFAATDSGGATSAGTCKVFVPAASVTVNGEGENSGGWSGSYTDLADNSDATFVQSSGAGTNTFTLAPVLPNTTAVLTVRAAQTGTGAALTVNLYQGTTLIASWTLSSLTTTPTDYPLSLTSTQVNAITNWNNLQVRFS